MNLDNEIELYEFMTVFAFMFPFIGVMMFLMQYRLSGIWLLLLIPTELMAFAFMYLWHKRLVKKGVEFGNMPGGWDKLSL